MNDLSLSLLAQSSGDETSIILAVLAIFAILVVFSIVFSFVPLRLWIAAKTSGARDVSIPRLIGMRLRRVNPNGIVDPYIAAVKAKVHVSLEQLEAHYLSGGRVDHLVRALISADRAKIPLDFSRAAAIDLAGRSVLDAVEMSVKPKVIDCPAPNSPRPTIDAVAKDGIQLQCKARVTVRANLERLVGGATEETIIARVGQGIVTTIGSAASHKEVLENPDRISKKILDSGLDAGTGFEILSIDIADIDIGKNIGAELQIDQAQADKQIAQAKAEERRALAVALEQENKALEQEMRARVVEAEASVPRALAEALKAGNLGVMDHLRLQNMEADTKMRRAFGQSDNPTPGGPTI
jgi:uncharacterized protein YqfA (UPF0365 family)